MRSNSDATGFASTDLKAFMLAYGAWRSQEGVYEPSYYWSSSSFGSGAGV